MASLSPHVRLELREESRKLDAGHHGHPSASDLAMHSSSNSPSTLNLAAMHSKPGIGGLTSSKKAQIRRLYFLQSSGVGSGLTAKARTCCAGAFVELTQCVSWTAACAQTALLSCRNLKTDTNSAVSPDPTRAIAQQLCLRWLNGRSHGEEQA